jgi:hypothetical protein
MMGCLVQVKAHHGPFDNSSTLHVMEDRLELGITLGIEAAQKTLRHSGMAQSEVEKALLVRGPSSAYDLDAEVAAGLFTLSAGSEPVLPTRVALRTDGLEALITMDYPRPAQVRTKLRALYFDAAEEMGPGALVVLDENGNRLARAMLSLMNTTAEVQLPTRTAAAATASAFPAVEPLGRGESTAVSAPPPVSPQAQVAPPSLWPIWAVGGVLVGTALAALWMESRQFLGSRLHSHETD